MVECPRCKSEDVELVKSWDVKPKSKRGKAIKVSIYQCRSCGNKFRKAVKLEESLPLEEAPAPLTQPASEAPVVAASPMETSTEAQTLTASDPPKESFLERLRRSFHLF